MQVLRLVLASVAVAFGVAADAFGHAPGVQFYGSGTATIDGVLTPGEWDRAAQRAFAAAAPANDGGGAVPVVLLAMNDAGTLYLALQIRRPHTGTTTAGFDFDNTHDGALGSGDDSLVTNPDPFFPPTLFDAYHQTAVSGSRADTSDSGTNDGSVAVSGAGGATVIEIAHPLDSADDRHDFSVRPGSVVGVRHFLRLWSLTPACNQGPSCYADTWFPGPTPNDFGDVVVAPDTVGPETSIDGGPLPGVRTRNRVATFRFSAVDNLSASDKLTFACSIDRGPFRTCSSPVRLRTLRIGLRRFAVRATDELGNVDPTPATRTWRVLAPKKKRR